MNLLIIHIIFMNEINHVVLMSKTEHNTDLMKKNICFYCANLIAICFKCSLINKSAFTQSVSIE